MITWEPAARPWAMRSRALTRAETELLDETLVMLADALGATICDCGLLADPGLANGEHCRSCWGRER